MTIADRENRLIDRIASDGPTPRVIRAFRTHIYRYFDEFGRDLPWRGDRITPYQTFISEVMLQQTQVDRVTTKFVEFTNAFPSFKALAAAPFERVLAHWSGLGYNRRALMLHRAAVMVVNEYGGALPGTPDELVKLPGIGPATAASIAAFGFNLPTVFIETNIRSVILHFFFNGEADVHDDQVLPLVEETLDRKHACRWYSAIMDYGSELKKRLPNPSRRSRHHVKQSTFTGSDRQIRGKILRYLLAEGNAGAAKICKGIEVSPERGKPILGKMAAEGLVRKVGRIFKIG